MKSSLDKRVAAKLFAGFIVSPDMKREMYISDKWHMAQIAWKGQKTGLEIVSYQNKDYVGKYLETPSPSLEELRDMEDKIQKQLLFHCPAIKPFSLDFFIFPQIFVT